MSSSIKDTTKKIYTLVRRGTFPSLSQRSAPICASQLHLRREECSDIPITRCISGVLLITTAFIFMFAVSVSFLTGSPVIIFILVLPSEIFRTASKKSFYPCENALVLFGNSNNVIGLYLDVFYLG